MKKYLVVIERAENNYSAFSPDVLGCIATGMTVEETTANLKEALQFHIENMEERPHAKGISHYIDEGIFNNEELATEFYITELEVRIPQHA
ncbi:MAG: type II toxin-antitoxin system HicB family antitoxin [Saprospiraceae bacterium]